eukprot:COSAG01_NODE_5082_length_4500_cov_42.527607_2_plen_85_part_00
MMLWSFFSLPACGWPRNRLTEMVRCRWSLTLNATANSSKTEADCEVLLDKHRGDANAVTEDDFAKLRGRLESKYSKLAVNGGSV